MRNPVMMPTPVLFSSLVLSVLIFSSCGSGDQSPVKTDSTATSHKSDSAKPLIQEPVSIADAATILARKQVPILCYHQLRDWKPTDSKSARDYIVPPAAFKQQMKALADSGYTTILPDELYSYLAAGTPLPPKPVMLTFDDTDLDQYSVAWPEMKQYNFRGVFFIMTVSIGRPRYMSKEQIKELSDAGNTIGSHTWDHHNVKKYSGEDWVTQVEKPSRQLEQITGKPVKYFAYPFGLWNPPAIPELKKRGIKAAFQLAEKRDEQDPLYTIRRIIITGTMSGEAMLAKMRNSF